MRSLVVAMATMSKVRLCVMANPIRSRDNSPAGSSISARVSTFTSGDGSPFEARLGTSILVHRHTTLQAFRVASTT
jgi:hypothetical protein